MTAQQPDRLLYLCRADVLAACADLDVVGLVASVLARHAAGETTLPDEAYLAWHNTAGAFSRSLALPGAVWGERPAVGLKVINSSLGNLHRGLPRAQGLTLVFDPERAHPVAVMEAAYLSGLRTAAYTVLSARLLAVPDPETVAVIGCGALGEQHARLLAREFPKIHLILHDRIPDQQVRMAERLAAAGLAVTGVGSAREAVTDAQLIVTTTTTTTSYLPYAWLRPGSLIAHVSLDDVMPDVVERADLVVVDDWNLVKADDRRLLGRLYRAGALAGPDGDLPAGAGPPGAAAPRAVDTTLADIVARRHAGRTHPDQIILSNPFGMGVLDVAFAAEVYRNALELGIGSWLPV